MSETRTREAARIGPPCFDGGNLRLRYNSFAPTPEQMAYLSLVNEEALFGGAAGAGKGVPLDTPIITPFGPRPARDIRVGTQVSNPEGGVSRVIAVYPRGPQPCWRVTFSDGASLVTDDDHLWRYRLSGKSRNRDVDWLMCTTPQLAEMATSAARAVADGRRPHHPLVPLAEPTEFTISSRNPATRWPIDPYPLGVLLGDGGLSGGHARFTSADDEIVDAMREWAESFGGGLSSDREMGYYVRQGDGLRVHEVLRSLGVCHRSESKYVPPAYLAAPIAIRRALMQGLMDTDGYVGERGGASYTSSSKQLATDVQWILWSLGYKARITEKPTTHLTAYTVTITGRNPKDLFRLTRKRDRCREPQSPGSRRVVSVERVPHQDTVCFKVDHPNGLFMAGDGFVVTHNSETLLMGALMFADVPGYNALLFRRTLQDLKLPDGLIPMSKRMLEGKGPRFNANDYLWTFPSGATLQFGYLKNPGDHLRYQGVQVQYIGWDELTQFPDESQYEYLFSRLRRPKMTRPEMLAVYGASPDGLTLADIPLRVRGATNPGGPGAHWVKARYVDPETAIAPFLPSSFRHNPGIDGNEYARSLARLSEVERRRLELGDWDVVEVPGALWRFTDIGRVEELPEFDVVAVGVDGAVSEGTGDECGIVVGGMANGTLTVIEDASLRAHPDIWAKRAVSVYHEHGATRLVIEENQGGALNRMILHNAADAMGVDRPHVIPVRANAGESKELRAQPVAQAYRAGKVVHGPLVRDTPLEAQMCLVASTPVLTASGEVPIKQVMAGDWTWTRRGWRRVEWSGATGYVTTLVDLALSNGQTMTLTPNHLVWVNDAGWTRADQLAHSDILYGCRTNPPTWTGSWSTAGVGSTPTPLPTGSTGPPSSTTGLTNSPCGESCCIECCGRTPTVPFPPDTMSTIEMATPSTTPSTTSIASPPASTRLITREVGPSGIPTRTCPPSARSGCGRVGNPRPMNASPVVTRLSPPGCVPCSAPVGVVAATTRRCAATEVFDLTVEGEHEFVAAGVIVHNSSWVPGDKKSVSNSPDRVDALVWMVNHLMFGAGGVPARSIARDHMTSWQRSGRRRTALG